MIFRTIMKQHYKARCQIYPRTETREEGPVERSPVPDEKVPWTEEFPEYTPIKYTAPSVLAMPVWADVDVTPECEK